MKKLTIFLINIYRAFISPSIRGLLGVYSTCRFTPSCSEYTSEMIMKHGVVTGIKKGLAQIVSCHPKGQYGTNI